MADTERQRTRARAWAAEVDAARRRAGLLLPGGLADRTAWLGRLISEWALAEVAPGRLLPWLPVAYGIGIALYFAADREPTAPAAAALAIAGAATAFVARRRAVPFAMALGFAGAAAGFATATLQTARIDHPVVRFQTAATITGYVEVREERARSDRIVVSVQHIEAFRLNPAPQRLRVAVRKGTAPAVGSFVTFKAHLAPPLEPLRPGGYDFARDLYFQRIGASGYVLGSIKTALPAQAPGLSLRYAALLDGMREAINQRIHALLPGDRGSIATALITGKRNAISDPVSDAFYVSSLAHVLAISGYHMAVVAGIAFFFVRAVLALIPGLAVRRPIKKWAALAALGAGAFYLVLSGASVSTQRAFIMIAIVLIGVMIDRPALTFRTIAIAAFVVLLFTPQAIVHPSFQMSFAAALALIAAYQFGLPWRADADTPHAVRIALWGGREIFALVMASLVAGLATTPYSAYHFHRLAPYGVLANLLAMPVISAWVMPMGILGVLTMPLGLDAVFWRLMGDGIDWMIIVVLWVAHLPGAVGHIHAFGTGPLLLATAGLLLLCLLRSPLRWSGAVLAVAAGMWVLALPRPDVIVASDGQAAAIRDSDGKLAVLHNSRDNFAIKEWLMADGDGRDPKDAGLAGEVRCDAVGCIGRLADGRLVSFALSVEAFAEDCARAAIVISPREAPGACTATLVDREVWRFSGALTLRRSGDRFVVNAARPPGYERPWAHGTVEPAPAARAAPDATPRPVDREADD